MSDNNVKKDPNGLIATDMAHLRKVFPKKNYTPSDSKDQIMFSEGEQKVLNYIETKMIHGHALRR